MSPEKNLLAENGKTPPDFSLPSHSGGKVTLSALRGHAVVVYFYPRDNTPGCTTEAKDFQQLNPEFQQLGAVVLGISPDSLESHCKFAEKFRLGFLLLADPEHQTAEDYGVWVEKNMYGKKHWGVQRATFLVGPDGKLARSWPKVKVEGHAAEVLEAVRELS